jgi:ADP-dependent NAD(P)H-hydrate dehydratase / NAD(P)H-hydrate epimerase
MLPVLGPEAIRAADAWTIANEPVTSHALMERAALACTQRIIAECKAGAIVPNSRYAVFCGMGNNGGDGLAIARQLRERGHSVRAVRVRHAQVPTSDNGTNWELALAAGVPCTEIIDVGAGCGIEQDEVVVDALFGTGLRGPLAGLGAEVVRSINTCGRPVLSIDMPSGLMPEDNSSIDATAIIHATKTYTFEVHKLAFLLPENERFVGVWEVLPIGLDRAFIAGIQTTWHVLEQSDVSALLMPRERFVHKGRFGHAALITGTTGVMGAAVLATHAALRSGAGLVSVHVPRGGSDVVQITAPEAMCSIDPDPDHISVLPDLKDRTAVGIGPGIGMTEGTQLVVKRLIQSAMVPCVLDADALNALAANPTWGAFLPNGSVLTPHPKEFDRLHGSPSSTGYERLQHARELAQRWRCRIVLKGAWSAICGPDGRVLFNPTGNPGMAKGGTGDVLTGLLTGLLAQGMDPMRACMIGVYIHGLAGDLAAQHLGMEAMTAGDLVDHLPAAWLRVRGR